jgi:uncharacterized membrane protein
MSISSAVPADASKRRTRALVAYFVILLAGVVSWWTSYQQVGATMGHALIWLWGIIPLTTIILCSYIIAAPSWKGKRWLAAILPMLIYLIHPLLTIQATINLNALATGQALSFVNLSILEIGLGVTVLSWVTGAIVRCSLYSPKKLLG